MSGETKQSISGWSVDTLHEHIRSVIDERDQRYEQRFQAQREAIKSELLSASRAVDKAEDMAEKWRANANEWRAAMSDKDKVYLTKEAFEARLHGLDRTNTEMISRLDRTEGRGLGINAGWVYLVAFIVAAAAVLSVVAAFMKH